MSSPGAGAGFSQGATASESETAAATKLPAAVVKKIVEADDDTSASAAEVARRNALQVKRGSTPAREYSGREKADGA